MKKLIALFITGAMVLATAPMAFAAEAKEAVGTYSITFSDGFTTDGGKVADDGTEITVPTKSTVTVAYKGTEKDWKAVYGTPAEPLYTISSEASQEVIVKYFESKEAADSFFETSKDKDTIPVYPDANGLLSLSNTKDKDVELFLSFSDGVPTEPIVVEPTVIDTAAPAADPAAPADAVEPAEEPAAPSAPAIDPAAPQVPPTMPREVPAAPEPAAPAPVVVAPEPVVASEPVVAAPLVAAPVFTAPVVVNPAPVYYNSLITTKDLVSTLPSNPLPAPVSKYTVQRGETFKDIAYKCYGTSTTSVVNRIKDANIDYLYSTKGVLEAGAVINLPAINQVGPALKYTVQKGETFAGIAYNYYGSSKSATVNKIKDANADYLYSTRGVLEAGAVITLPAKGLLNPLTTSGLNNVAGVYLVQPNDNLSSIAKKYYGDANLWRKIYTANQDRIEMVGKVPMIYDQQWLIIPN